MNKIITLFILVFQIALAFIANFCIYILFALLDSDFGIDGLLGLFFFQPIIAVILSVLTILFCLIIGLPIRLNNKLNCWWTTNFYISIIGVICGLTFLFLALFPAFRETVTYNINEQPTLKQIPNTIFSVLGWFLTTFFLLHLYPPRRLISK